jgi:hypothetical protein
MPDMPVGGGTLHSIPTPRKSIILYVGVLIGKPTKSFGGVIQYDYGKAIGEGRFERTSALKRRLLPAQ